MEPVVDTLPITELLDERRHLLEVAHWMLGSRLAAERVTDEAYRRWYGLSDHQRERITTPRAWLTQVVGDICLVRLALPGRREDAQGPVPRREQHGSGLEGEVSAVLLRTLDTLPPVERAAFVVNDVFGVAPGTVAGIVERSEAECAEPADRARRSMRARRAQPTPPRRQDEIAHAVRHACADGDADRLASLLTPDATAFFDGGGKVRALTRPVTGSGRVARSLLTLLARHPRTTLHTHPANGRTGLVVRYDDQVAAVITLDITGSRVVQVWVVLNPDKLRSWNRSRP
ncbi:MULTISPECIES: RNA polymerase subunit sigma [Streptomyces]|uniref:RNA polymerase sigma factor n=1 Tax=Streptomyces canarius TaxID=285453 RepID=A0ABQ3D261_9ACTN|nr:RNA polymerase subunit sigma [Streptomyces canarius]GHA54565.1 RNA polymerase sigma factor [Streptomyces canarius]